MAAELNSFGTWKRALDEGGFTEDGSKQKKPLSDVSVPIDWGPRGTNVGDTILSWLYSSPPRFSST